MKKSRTTDATVPVAPPMTQLERLTAEAAWEMQFRKADCDKWAARFAENPADALSWSHPVFDQAARLKVATMVHAYLTQDEVDLAKLRRMLADEAFRAAR
jgi:hypothetical protein